MKEGIKMAKIFKIETNDMEGFKKAYDEVYQEQHSWKYPTQKYLVTFRKPVTIVHNKRMTKEETSIELSFFIASNGYPCYSTRISPRHGRYVTQEMYENMESISLRAEADFDNEQKTRRLVGRFHPNLWTNIQEELINTPSTMKDKYYNNFSTVNLTSKFPKSVMAALKKAIENREDYSYRQYGEKRDMSIETKLGDDGVYRAWFSSEFSGCGNGSYYLIINPTTAAFREDD